MGMSFSPMYQPVTSSSLKADGDLDISPYDLLCTDAYADTVEATEFVGGVGNFTSIRGQRIIDWTCSTSGTTVVFPEKSYSSTGAFAYGDTKILFNDVLPINDLSGFDAGFGNTLGTLGQEFNLIVNCQCSDSRYCSFFTYKAKVDDTEYSRTGAGSLSIPINNTDSVVTLSVTSTFSGGLGYTATMGYSNYYLASI